MNYHKEGIIVIKDFKVLDFIRRDIMFSILQAYGIPFTMVDAIMAMYVENSAVVITDDVTNEFSTNAGVLQGSPLTALLFIIVLDYALRLVIRLDDGLTLKRRRSSHHPAVHLADLLHLVQLAAKSVCLQLNASQTKWVHFSPTSDQRVHALDSSRIEKVDDFQYLGSWTDTAHDIVYRKAKAWGALPSF